MVGWTCFGIDFDCQSCDFFWGSIGYILFFHSQACSFPLKIPLAMLAYVILFFFACSVVFAKPVSQNTNDGGIGMPEAYDAQGSECSLQSSNNFVDENQVKDVLQRRSDSQCKNPSDPSDTAPQSNPNVAPSSQVQGKFNMCPYPPYRRLVTCPKVTFNYKNRNFYIMGHLFSVYAEIHQCVAGKSLIWLVFYFQINGMLGFEPSSDKWSFCCREFIDSVGSCSPFQITWRRFCWYIIPHRSQTTLLAHVTEFLSLWYRHKYERMKCCAM